VVKLKGEQLSRLQLLLSFFLSFFLYRHDHDGEKFKGEQLSRLQLLLSFFTFSTLHATP
jgi:hypothetical protein